jgi:hypothetical protein
LAAAILRRSFSSALPARVRVALGFVCFGERPTLLADVPFFAGRDVGDFTEAVSESDMTAWLRARIMVLPFE